MKKYIFSILFSLVSIITMLRGQNHNEPAADTTSVKTAHEFGLNTTFLLKQVFNLSGSSFTTLPYDLTYKAIFRKTAIRCGAGFVYQNLTSTSTNSNASSIAGPDPIPDDRNETRGLFLRAGYEWRRKISKKMICYYGADLVFESNRSFFQNHTLNNGLPSYYQFTSSRQTIKETGIGGGPVAGIQYMFNAHFGIFTECPVYFILSSQTDENTSYSNFYNSGSFYASEGKNSSTISSSELTLTLPVTIYISVKF